MKQFLTTFFAALALTSSVASGQLVRGSVTDDVAGRPLPAVIVTLQSAGGDRIVSVYSDAAGKFVLQAPASGKYTIRLLRIGYRAYDVPPFDVRKENVDVAPVAMHLLEHWLDTVYVNGNDECVLHPKASTPAGTIWNAARLALTGALAVSRDTATKLQFERYSQIVGNNGTSGDATANIISTTAAEPPRASDSPQTFARKGYFYDGLYHGPDANVLLHDSFAGAHCFRAPRSIDPSSDVVVLKFEPERSRQLVDIAGELTFDRKTGALRDVQFRYVGPGIPANNELLGGNVEFMELPSGQWIVRGWELRAPFAGYAKLKEDDVYDTFFRGYRLDGLRLVAKPPPLQ
jgi:hypothetical protein